MTPLTRRQLLFGAGLAALVGDALADQPHKARETVLIEGVLLDSGTEREMTHLLIDTPKGVYHYTGTTSSLRYVQIPSPGAMIKVEGSYRGRCKERRLFPVLKDSKYRDRPVYELGPIGP